MKLIKSIPVIILAALTAYGCSSDNNGRKAEANSSSGTPVKVEKVKVMTLEPVLSVKILNTPLR